LEGENSGGGKLRRGTAGMISTLCNDSTFVAMVKKK
jgi:hypothetical protein